MHLLCFYKPSSQDDLLQNDKVNYIIIAMEQDTDQLLSAIIEGGCAQHEAVGATGGPPKESVDATLQVRSAELERHKGDRERGETLMQDETEPSVVGGAEGDEGSELSEGSRAARGSAEEAMKAAIRMDPSPSPSPSPRATLHIPTEAGEAPSVLPRSKVFRKRAARLPRWLPWLRRRDRKPSPRGAARAAPRTWHRLYGRALWRVRQKQTWRVVTGWVLCVSTIVVCAYFTILYGLKYGRSDSVAWLTATVFSLILDIFVIQPLKIVALSLVLAFWYERDAGLEKKEAPYSRAVRVPELPPSNAVPSPGSAPASTPEMYRPLTRTEAEVLLVLRKHRQRLARRAFNTLLWMVWMVFMYSCLASASDSLHYYMLKHVSGMVIDATHTRTRSFGTFSDVIRYKEVHDYLNQTLIGSLLWRKATPEDTPEVLHPYVGFTKDNVSRVVGAIRLRQQRVKNISRECAGCSVAQAFSLPGLLCLDDLSSASIDTEDHGEGWWRPAEGTDPNLGQHSLAAWKYHSAWEPESFSLLGYDTLIRGGGYVMNLGRVARNADMALRYLANSSWLDSFTRVLFVEFVVFSPYSNIFCDAYITLERSPASSFHYSSKLYTYRLPWATGHWTDTELTLFMMLLAMSAGILVREVLHMVRAGREYLWNWFDVLLVLVIATNGILYFTVNNVLSQLLGRLRPLDQKAFFSFQSATRLHFGVTIGLGVMVVMATVRCWRVLGFALHFKIVRIMLKLAYGHLLVMLLHLMLVQLQFALLFLLLMGSSYDKLHTVQKAFILLLAYLVDYTADYEEFAAEARDNPLSLVSYWIFVAFMYFFFLNFFLGIVSMAFENAVEIVRQKEIEGFSLSKLICDELRYLLHIPGGRLRRDSSLFRHVRRDFVTRNHRIHGEARFVSVVEMGALNAIYKLTSGLALSERELDSAMAALVVNAVSPPEEMPTGGHELLPAGFPLDGEQRLDVGRLHHVMDTLNSRLAPETPHTVVDPENLLALSGLLREFVEQRAQPPSDALSIRARRGRPAPGPTTRVAYLSVRRGRSVQVRLRLLRVPAPASPSHSSIRRRHRRSALAVLAVSSARVSGAAPPVLLPTPSPARTPPSPPRSPSPRRPPWRP